MNAACHSAESGGRIGQVLRLPANQRINPVLSISVDWTAPVLPTGTGLDDRKKASWALGGDVSGMGTNFTSTPSAKPARVKGGEWLSAGGGGSQSAVA